MPSPSRHASLAAHLISWGSSYRRLFLVDRRFGDDGIGHVRGVNRGRAAASRFVVLSCINTVAAANAGGAFSPFGDITALIVWQKGLMPFQDFLLAACAVVTPKIGAHRLIAPFGARLSPQSACTPSCTFRPHWNDERPRIPATEPAMGELVRGHLAQEHHARLMMSCIGPQ